MANSFCQPPYMNSTIDGISNFHVDTKWFTKSDLSLFVESLETISRLEREKQERQQRHKERRKPVLDFIEQIRAFTLITPPNSPEKELCTKSSSNLPSTADQKASSADQFVKSSNEEIEHGLIHNQVEEEKCVINKMTQPDVNSLPDNPHLASSNNFHEEAYFSSSEQNSPRSSKNYKSDTNSSDSEESGVFPTAREGEVIDENGQMTSSLSVRRESMKITTSIDMKESHRRSRKRYRIFEFVLKREQVTSTTTATTLSQKQQRKMKKKEEKLRRAEEKRAQRRDRLIDDLVKQGMTHVRRGVAVEESSANVRFLSKALRYMTL